MPSEPSEDKHPSNPGRKGTASTMEQKWQQGQVQTMQPVWTHAEGMQKVLVIAIAQGKLYMPRIVAINQPLLQPQVSQGPVS
jgi:hypothetical protein